MNERIRELADQAGITTNIDTDYFEKDPNKWVDYYTEKLSELIIKECMDIAQEYDAPKLGGPGLIIAMRIEQHFGIEE